MRYDLSEIDEVTRRGILRWEGMPLAEIVDKVRPIVDSVRAEGDSALLRYAKEFEGFTRDGVRVPREAVEEARERVPKALRDALETSKERIEAFHSRQQLHGFEFEDRFGFYGQAVRPLERVGIYAPGGTASYASSVIMAAVPAKLAGVGETVLCSPSRDDKVEDVVLAAASMCDIDEVYSVGGAHSVAAMAYGTESIQRVSKIVGPGGAFVTAAKMLVRSDCAIDSLAGPSEVLIIADSGADVESIAIEMLAQLEHDPLARAVLVATDDGVLTGSIAALERLSSEAGRGEIVRSAAESGAVFVKATDVAEAVDFSNEYAPEHLMILTETPRKVLDAVSNAASVFLGESSSVSFGDYCSGTNHILPTMGMAVGASSLSVYDFLKVMSYQAISPEGAKALAPVVTKIAAAEGLPNHAKAATRAGGARR